MANGRKVFTGVLAFMVIFLIGYAVGGKGLTDCKKTLVSYAEECTIEKCKASVIVENTGERGVFLKLWEHYPHVAVLDGFIAPKDRIKLKVTPNHIYFYQLCKDRICSEGAYSSTFISWSAYIYVNGKDSSLENDTDYKWWNLYDEPVEEVRKRRKELILKDIEIFKCVK